MLFDLDESLSGSVDGTFDEKMARFLDDTWWLDIDVNGNLSGGGGFGPIVMVGESRIEARITATRFDLELRSADGDDRLVAQLSR